MTTLAGEAPFSDSNGRVFPFPPDSLRTSTLSCSFFNLGTHSLGENFVSAGQGRQDIATRNAVGLPLSGNVYQGQRAQVFRCVHSTRQVQLESWLEKFVSPSVPFLPCVEVFSQERRCENFLFSFFPPHSHRSISHQHHPAGRRRGIRRHIYLSKQKQQGAPSPGTSRAIFGRSLRRQVRCSERRRGGSLGAPLGTLPSPAMYSNKQRSHGGVKFAAACTRLSARKPRVQAASGRGFRG